MWRRSPTITISKTFPARFFFLSPSNDFHGRINDLPAALHELKTREWRLTISPHHNHQDTAEYEVATQVWMDQCLKGTIQVPQTPKTTLTLKTDNGVPKITVEPDTSRPILGVEVYYSREGRLDEKPMTGKTRYTASGISPPRRSKARPGRPSFHCAAWKSHSGSMRM